MVSSSRASCRAGVEGNAPATNFGLMRPALPSPCRSVHQVRSIKTREDPRSKAIMQPSCSPTTIPDPHMPAEGNFTCPKCGRRFTSWDSCHAHARGRGHARFCRYDTSDLPSCTGYHSMLPFDPHSGWCDVQGRRAGIEDFHRCRVCVRLMEWAGWVCADEGRWCVYAFVSEQRGVLRDLQVLWRL